MGAASSAAHTSMSAEPDALQPHKLRAERAGYLAVASLLLSIWASFFSWDKDRYLQSAHAYDAAYPSKAQKDAHSVIDISNFWYQ
mgnify:CR=1 FL=1